MAIFTYKGISKQQEKAMMADLLQYTEKGKLAGCYQSGDPEMRVNSRDNKASKRMKRVKAEAELEERLAEKKRDIAKDHECMRMRDFLGNVLEFPKGKGVEVKENSGLYKKCVTLSGFDEKGEELSPEKFPYGPPFKMAVK